MKIENIKVYDLEVSFCEAVPMRTEPPARHA